MNGKRFKELINNNIGDNDIVVVSRGNAFPSFKITGIDDSTVVGVWEIRIDDFKTNDLWEE